MKVVLTKVTRYTTDKNGAPLMGKNGKPYSRVNIQTQEHGEKWLSGFGGPITQNWAEGQSVEIITKQNGEYLNFEVPRAGDVKLDQLKGQLKAKFEQLESRIKELEVKAGIRSASPEQMEDAFANNQPTVSPPVAQNEEPPVEAYEKDAGEIKADDIPW